MKNTASQTSTVVPVYDRFSFLWLILAGVILTFANGTLLIPVAAWVGPIFMLRFLRTQKAWPGLLIGYLVNGVAFFLQWRSAFQDAGAMFSLYSAAFGLLVFIPYVVDRLLRPRLRGFTATLVLPVAWVTVEYALHLLLPLATFFSIAYTQHMNLPLLQLMSLTGMWGVTFLVAWCASVVNYAWEASFDFQRAGRGLALYAAILLVVLLGGGLRLVLAPPTGETVQVAALVTNVNKEVLPEMDSPMDKRLIAGTLTEADRQEITAKLDEINTDLMARTRIQARAGARIVTWTEYNAHVFKDQETQFLDTVRQLAREEGIYIAFPLATIQPDVTLRAKPALVVENKSVMVTPQGEIAYQYLKANLLIGWEYEHAVRGPRQIQYVDTPYGRLSSVICLDMDYPDFMRQAGRLGVDIMLSGAIDGTPSSKGNPIHSVMASYRTIESGFSLARGGFYAQTVAVDYQGHTLGSFNYYTAGDRTLVAHLPIHGTKTLYQTLGDFLPWLCMATLALLAAVAVIRKPISVSK